jgi:ornithine racemase
VPELRIDIEAIGRNTEVVAAMLREQGVDLVAVTKGCLGEPRVAAAMLAGGAVALADTRDQNLRRLRQALPGAELHRIHLPSLTEPFEPGDLTYVSNREGAVAVAATGGPATVGASAVTGASAATATTSGAATSVAGPRVPRRVMVQLETGDEREGVPAEHLMELVEHIAADRRLRLEGVSTNFACFLGCADGVRTSVEAVAAAAVDLKAAGLPITRVSGGNSSLLWLLRRGLRLPGEVTELRCGEALLLGQDALHYEPLPGCRTDACVLRAEVVEEYTKPAPQGPGPRTVPRSGPTSTRRLVLGIGRQDLSMGAVRFVEPGLREVGRSADYLVVEVAAAAGATSALRVGTSIEMIPAYEALVAAWTSPYVGLRLGGRRTEGRADTEVGL